MIKQEKYLYQNMKENKILYALIIIFWLFLLLTTINKNYSYFIRQDMPVEMHYILFDSFLIWGLAAVFAPLFIWLSQRLPIKAGNAYRNVGIHIVFSLVFIPVYSLLFESIMFPIYEFLLEAEANKQALSMTFWERFLISLRGMGGVAPIWYWLVVGGYHFKKYYGAFKDRKFKNIQMEAELASIRLRVLKAQLHPHFLFNTLHNVNTLIEEDPPTAERILVLLKRFLFLSIQRVDDQLVPLKDEIEFTDIYLEIEQTRFSDRLAIERDIESATQNALVPSMMLQPLVENAVRHGISKQIKPGVIKISTKKVGTSLLLTIEDNGPGLSEGKMDSDGIGLKNIRQRLLHLYDKPAFELNPSSMGGLKVKIEIPFENIKALTSHE